MSGFRDRRPKRSQEPQRGPRQGGPKRGSPPGTPPTLAKSQTRTFVAVPVDDDIRDDVDRLVRGWRRDFPGVRWASPESLHFTLAFLGDIDNVRLPEVCAAMAEAAAKHEPFEVDLRGVGGFPNLRSARTLWIGVADAGPWQALHDDLADALRPLGYRREPRGYTPHLTIGRLRDGVRLDAGQADELARQHDWDGGGWRVDELHTLGSDLRPTGPEYAIVGRAPLGEPHNDFDEEADQDEADFPWPPR